jgi:hypothetical protein
MQDVHDPQAANWKGFRRRDAYRIAVGIGWNNRRIIDLNDRISCSVDVCELQGRSLRRGYETIMCKTRKRKAKTIRDGQNKAE